MSQISVMSLVIDLQYQTRLHKKLIEKLIEKCDLSEDISEECSDAAIQEVNEFYGKVVLSISSLENKSPDED